MAVIMDEKRKITESLFDWAKSDQGWPLIRGALTKFPELAHETGGRWGEGLLHWAALGHLAGVLDLVAHHANLDQVDLEGRKAVDWAVEKAYFISIDPPSEMPIAHVHKMRNEAEACAIALIQNGASTVGATEGKDEGYALIQLALRAGLSALSEELLKKENLNQPLEALWTWFFAGKWDKGQSYEVILGDMITVKEAIETASSIPMDEFKTGSGEPLGLLAVRLYIQQVIPLDQLVKLHRLGARVDAESDAGEGFEDLCASEANGVELQLRIEKACLNNE